MSPSKLCLIYILAFTVWVGIWSKLHLDPYKLAGGFILIYISPYIWLFITDPIAFFRVGDPVDLMIVVGFIGSLILAIASFCGVFH